MSNEALMKETIGKIATSGKGILAADESTPTITKRFQAVGIESTEDSRRAYRELLTMTPGANQFIAGVILFEETLNQTTSSGKKFPEALDAIGIVPGIKVDKGLINLEGSDVEKITQGLDGLADRLKDYKAKGARFAKWRATYTITDTLPSTAAIEQNADILAQYAKICQEEGIVPIVEPETLIDGDHTIERCEEISVPVLTALFDALKKHGVKLEYIILKPSMVISGKGCATQSDAKTTAEATIRVLRKSVPAEVPTINFLSGGQSSEQATQNLNEMNKMDGNPWNVSYSYARALQEDCMRIWAGKTQNEKIAQSAFLKRAKLNSLAAMGKYETSMESEEVTVA